MHKEKLIAIGWGPTKLWSALFFKTIGTRKIYGQSVVHTDMICYGAKGD